jgi:hypothetical protein
MLMWKQAKDWIQPNGQAGKAGTIVCTLESRGTINKRPIKICKIPIWSKKLKSAE